MGSRERVVLPGATLGVLGGGQLGRMEAIAARRMGYRVVVLDPEADCPASHVADEHIQADYGDEDAARRLARAVSVVTFEFENVPAATLAAIEALAPVRPGPGALEICRHRVLEKRFLAGRGFPVAPFHVVESLADLEEGLRQLGPPAILKTAEFGYDGKGQRRIQSIDEAAAAYAPFAGRAAVLEAVVPFDAELSVIGARGLDGDFRAFPLLRNAHARHILDVTRAPAGVPLGVETRARELARAIAEALELVGLVTVELFLVGDELIVNELAPRTHNSGHGTIEAASTDQFEQHLRAVCGLPLGETELLRPFAMANLLGDIWGRQEPHWARALSEPGVRLHLYGKKEPRAGRKMGHLTALAASADAAEALVRRARSLL